MLVMSLFACAADFTDASLAESSKIRAVSGGTLLATTIDPRHAELAGAVWPGSTTNALVARIDATASAGTFPLEVTFDGSASDVLSGSRFEWTFGDGTLVDGVASASHTYVGVGSFEATLTLIDDLTGALSSSTVTIDVDYPACPVGAQPLMWGHVDDAGLNELSGIVTSRIDSDAYWVHEDSGNTPVLTSIDKWGATQAVYTLPGAWSDFEDVSVQVDPATGVSTLFMGDIGNNGHDRGEIAVWIAEEPDPHVDGALDPVLMALTYPNGRSLDSETLLVDPLTLDLFIVSKEYDGPISLFVKRAPHVGEGPFELEDLGELPFEMTATGGDVSSDGTRIVIRDYSPTALVWNRDGYRPLEDALFEGPCEIEIENEPQGEAIAFTADGGIVTVSEGTQEPLNYVGL